jgi:hypothetical protein
MRSQETLSLFKSAKEIRVAIDADGERIGGLLNETNPLPVPEGEPTFDYRLHFQHLSHQLDVAVGDTELTEDQHSAQLIRVARFQSERDETVKSGYDTLVWARQGLESLYPNGGFELGFLKGKTPEVPDKLLEQLGQTVKLLREPAVDLREVKVRGFSADFGEVASELETEVASVQGALDRLGRGRKDAEGTLVVKRKAVEALRRTLLWVGRTTEGLFHLAGESELAERIRKSTRRPPRPSEEEPAPEPPPPGEPPSGEPGPEPASDTPAPQPSDVS